MLSHNLFNTCNNYLPTNPLQASNKAMLIRKRKYPKATISEITWTQKLIVHYFVDPSPECKSLVYPYCVHNRNN